MTAVRRVRRLRWWQPTAVAVAAGLTVALAQSTTGAVFTTQTVDTGNQVTAAASFCTAPGRVDTLTTGTVDTALYQSQASTNYSTNVSIGTVATAGGVVRSLIKFPLAAKPTGCAVTSAVLTMHVNNGTAGTTIQVYRAAAAWNPTTVTWSSDPGFTGTAATNSSAATGTVVTWNVPTLVTALYSGPDYGFEIKDAAEGVGSITELYDSMEATTVANRPQLVITWG